MFSRTERLLLRPGWAEDAQAVAGALNDEALVRNLFHIPAMLTAEDAEKLIGSDSDPLAPQFLLFARTGGAPRLVGSCGITRGEGDASELGFWIARPFWGLGFATEACAAVIRFARAAGLRRLIARPSVDNGAAAHVLVKLGFHPTGRSVKRFSLGRGREVACAVFEDSGANPARTDPATDLYLDRAPVAA